MAFSQRHLIAACIGTLSLIASNGYAQAQASTEAQFRVMSVSGLQSLFFDVDKETKYVTASAGSLSRLYPAPKNRKVVFFQETPNPDPKLPPIKTLLARAQLPAGSPGPFIILINRNSRGDGPKFNTMVLDHSLDEFPAKTCRVYNFSKRQLAVRLDETNMLLAKFESGSAPYQNASGTDSSSGAGGPVKIWIKVGVKAPDGNWLVVRSVSQTVGSNSRTTMFIVDLRPSEHGPDPLGVIVRPVRERIYTDPEGVQHVR